MSIQNQTPAKFISIESSINDASNLLATSHLQLDTLLSELVPHLDLSTLLERYFVRLNKAKLIDGLRYEHLIDLDISLGASAQHSCQYEVKLQNTTPLGSLTFMRATAFTETDTRRLEQALGVFIHPLNNALCYRNALQMALIDSLTGTQNRIGFDTCLEREVALARRHNSELSILIVDIDHFKMVNDNHGHLAGDTVLRSVADALQASTRQTDALFRYGGEEFALILPQTSLAGSHVIAERIRTLIHSHDVSYKGGKLNVSVSIGAAQITKNDSLSSFFDRADSALYSAKNCGRNQVSLAQ